jgi:polyphosphate kinase
VKGRVVHEVEGITGGQRYFNREHSWLRFNERVLEEAENVATPVLERVKFLAIFESNLDEFFMVRVSGLIEQVEGGITELSPDGLTATEQLNLVAEASLPLRKRAGAVWTDELRPELERHGVVIHPYAELNEAQKEQVDEYFEKELFHICTPLLLHPAPNTPFISNRSLNLLVVLDDPGAKRKLARVKIPTGTPRFIRLGRRRSEFVLIEDVIRNNLESLFPGVPILGAYEFKVLRDADIEIRDLEAADLVGMIEQTLHKRRFGDPVLLQVSPAMPSDCRRLLMRLLLLDKEDVFELDGMLGLEGLWELASVDKPALRYAAHQPHLEEKLDQAESLFATVANDDVIVHHPFDSFKSVEQFVGSAAVDPEVIGVKQTLYRVGAKSPIVESLLDAAQEGKQVAVMVELKARFDESNNLVWAKALERAGVHVSYGFAELKTHAKLCLIVRRENGQIRSYAHIGTGNYNPDSARLYTDFGIFTSDEAICQDIAELFNVLTGYSRQTAYRKLLVAPHNLREEIIARIYREIDHKTADGRSRILFKLNSLVDPEVIDALYDASRAGVEIDLIVRGICCLRPGVSALSENIRVRSIVGRFLEHSRAYYFENGGLPELYIGSADLMRRNLDRRVEVLAPVQDREHIELVRQYGLEAYLKDNLNAWELQPDGTYRRCQPTKTDPPFRVQTYLIEHPLTKLQFEES